ncbi:hypothetical protein EGR_09369 [Echinococcus granulosus]|uniref:Uncharacterized protein n=1 Tax=Echinococcus granulosus TaxID=6210 RepID=W6U5C9_ECHGR|nr:hypothetical protein EGR_09369 [Echinococcus granulosus]EUB55761.1 hypothetical protein EGR_09369 [Echinococcus granulosus]
MTIYKEIARRFGSAWQFSHTEAAILTTSVVLHMFVCFILFRWEIISHLNQSCFPNFGMAFNPPLLACLRLFKLVLIVQYRKWRWGNEKVNHFDFFKAVKRFKVINVATFFAFAVIACRVNYSNGILWINKLKNRHFVNKINYEVLRRYLVNKFLVFVDLVQTSYWDDLTSRCLGIRNFKIDCLKITASLNSHFTC